MKSNIKIRIICLVTASILLVGAVAAAAVQGSPYETLKDALFSTGTRKNYTVESTSTIKVDGAVHETEINRSVYSENGYVSYYITEPGNREYFSYNVDGLAINPFDRYMFDDERIIGEQWYSARISEPNFGSQLYEFGWEDRDSAQVRFIEVFADLIVGDLKNNLTMSSAGGIRTVRGVFQESQIPEIIKAGIDMLIEQDSSYNSSRNSQYTRADFAGKSPLEIPMRELIVDSVRLEADIDEYGGIIRLDFSCELTVTNIFGETNTVESISEAKWTDIGTSYPECPIPGAKELLTPDWVQDYLGEEYADRWIPTIYFKLNKDGSIDADSISMDYPGGRDIDEDIIEPVEVETSDVAGA